MNGNLPPFLKKSGNSILYNGDGEFFFYIPEKYFERNIAYYVGDIISTLGVMDYAMSDAKGKLGPLHPFNYPTRFETQPNKVNKLKGVKLIKESTPMDYRVLVYHKDDPIIVNVYVPEDVSNVEDLMKLFVISGFIPNTIPYDQIQYYFLDNAKYNGINYGVTLQLFGIVLSEICRSKTDVNKPFRLSKDADMNDYNSISIKTVSKLISAYSAITSENFNEAVVFASLNDKDVTTPLERVVTGEDI